MLTESQYTDPALFVVRDAEYPQLEGYPERCAKITDALIAQKPQTLNNAVLLVSKAIRENRDDFATPLDRKYYLFGIIRSPGRRISTPAYGNRYSPPVHRLLEESGQPTEPSEATRKWSRKFAITHPAFGEIPLSAFTLDPKEESQYAIAIRHPSSRGRDDYEHERRWGMMSEEFSTALTAGTPEERRRHGLMCYALISHDQTLLRGNASLARIVLQYLARMKGHWPQWEHADMPIPFTKQNSDLNMEAISRMPEQFVTDFLNGTFADIKTRSEDILSWHKERATQIPREPEGVLKSRAVSVAAYHLMHIDIKDINDGKPTILELRHNERIGPLVKKALEDFGHGNNRLKVRFRGRNKLEVTCTDFDAREYATAYYSH